MNEIWNARRVRLETAVRVAAMDLFQHTGGTAFSLLLDPPATTLFVVGGDFAGVQFLVSEYDTTQCGG